MKWRAMRRATQLVFVCIVGHSGAAAMVTTQRPRPHTRMHRWCSEMRRVMLSMDWISRYAFRAQQTRITASSKCAMVEHRPTSSNAERGRTASKRWHAAPLLHNLAHLAALAIGRHRHADRQRCLRRRCLFIALQQMFSSDEWLFGLADGKRATPIITLPDRASLRQSTLMEHGFVVIRS